MGMENGTNQKNTSLIGERFGRLVVLQNVTTKGKTKLLCKCDCGIEKIVRLDHLKGGLVVSCGCYQASITGDRSRTHGMSKTRLYRIWKGMRNRCYNKNTPGFELWGGRGITVCDSWQHFEPFFEWAVANGYTDELSIDRIDNNGNYEPSNCRWANKTEQARNRRSNRMITFNGITKYISDWDKDIGSRKSGRVHARLEAGWSIEKAVTTSVTSGNSKL